jgi:hypothetical protein
MNARRVIFTLADGRRKYATHNGKMLTWDENDLDSLYDNIERFGMPAFTADFQKYDVSAVALKRRFPEAKILRVKSIETENAYNNPLNPEIIF